MEANPLILRIRSQIVPRPPGSPSSKARVDYAVGGPNRGGNIDGRGLGAAAAPSSDSARLKGRPPRGEGQGSPGRDERKAGNSHKSNSSETALQPGITGQGAPISHTYRQCRLSPWSHCEDSQASSASIGSSQKARGVLARRPSYKKIFNDLSSEDTRDRRGDEENPRVSTVTSISVPTPIYQTSTGQYKKSLENVVERKKKLCLEN
ncbi:LOW QUALITY PROTEIN: cyclic AMP-dependent transcription factor ATF-1-like [Phascolarctos cinereus]